MWRTKRHPENSFLWSRPALLTGIAGWWPQLIAYLLVRGEHALKETTLWFRMLDPQQLWGLDLLAKGALLLCLIKGAQLTPKVWFDHASNRFFLLFSFYITALIQHYLCNCTWQDIRCCQFELQLSQASSWFQETFGLWSCWGRRS